MTETKASLIAVITKASVQSGTNEACGISVSLSMCSDSEKTQHNVNFVQ